MFGRIFAALVAVAALAGGVAAAQESQRVHGTIASLTGSTLTVLVVAPSVVLESGFRKATSSSRRSP